ncbi:MAG: hypothetical protein ACK47V_09045, partial [Betaproteobacteria bacterium]
MKDKKNPSQGAPAFIDDGVPAPDAAESESQDNTKNPFLLSLGERVRALRSRRGMTRKALART